MAPDKNLVRRWIVVGIVGVLVGLVMVGWLRGHPSSMTLPQALWVCTADMKAYYPPGSPEALHVIEQLGKSPSFNVAQYRTDHFLCYRMNLTEKEGASEPLLWEIDPATLPSRSIQRTAPPR